MQRLAVQNFPYSLISNGVDGNRLSIIAVEVAPVEYQTIGETGGKYSILIRFRSQDPNTVKSSSTTSATLLEMKKGTTTNRRVPFSIGLVDGKIAFGRSRGSGLEDIFVSNKIVANGNWQWVLFTVNSNTVKIFSKGVLDSTHTLIGSSGDASVGTATDTKLQWLSRATDANVFIDSAEATVAEVAIYEGDLSDSSEALYAALQNLSNPLGTYTQAMVDTLKGHWKPSEGTGSTVADETAFGNDGTITSLDWDDDGPLKPRLAVRDFPFSLDFDGTFDRVDFGDNFDKERTDAFSVSGWIFLPSLVNTGVWMGKRDIANEGYELRIDPTNNLEVTFEGSNASVFQVKTTEALSVSEWQHLVVTYNGNGQASGVKVYVDHSIVGLTILTDSLTADITNSAPFRFGARSNNTQDLLGFQTQNRVHNAELFQADVDNLYYNNVATDVQGYWDFSDGSGSTLTAKIGGVNGTITGATWSAVTPFKARTAITQERFAVRDFPFSLDFDFSPDKVDFGNNFDFEKTDAFSFSFWSRPRNLTATQTILAKRAGAVAGYEVRFGVGDGKYRLTLSDSGGNRLAIEMATTVLANEWKFITATYDGSATPAGIKFYVNSVLSSNIQVSNALVGTITNTSNFTIGARPNDSVFFDGSLTDVRVHNSELTQAEVSDLYFSYRAVDVQGYWDFSDGSGSTLTAKIGGVNGTITGATWSTDTPPFKARTPIS